MYKKGLMVLFLLVIGVFFINNIYAEDIQSTFLFPCDTGEDISKTARVDAGKETEICFQFQTKAEQPINIKYSFINKQIDAVGDSVCGVVRDNNDIFNKIFPNLDERSITITKDIPYIVKEKIRVPLGASGAILGCIQYTTQNIGATGIGGMLDLIIRKVFPISFFVGGSEGIKNSIEILNNDGGNYSTDNKVKATVDQENNINVGFLIKNNGNITQSIVITGKVYNFFGFVKDFSLSKELEPGTTGDLLSNVGMLPTYKGLFTVKYTINNQPKFDFDTSSIDGKYKTGGSIIGSAQVFIFSWIRVGAIIVVLLLLIKGFRPRKRNQVPQTQTQVQI